MFSSMATQMLWQGTRETLYMVAVSVFISHLVGLPLGVFLTTTDKGHILQNVPVNKVLGAIVNVGRSIPFIILMVAIIPFTRFVAGTSIGTTAAIVPLTVAAIPFVARLVESALKEVDSGVIEAAQAMGSTPFEIIRKVLLPEAMPSLVLGFTLTAVSLVGFSAMAGAIGGGGLGDLAIRFGYQRFRGDIMLQTVIVLVILVQGIQTIGDWVSRSVNKR